MSSRIWTSENHARYHRRKLRYLSDLTNATWGHVASMMLLGRRGGGKHKVNLRAIFIGLMYVLSTSCRRRAIQKDLPPKSAIYGYFDLWAYFGTLDHIDHALCMKFGKRRGVRLA
jgi:transposase